MTSLYRNNIYKYIYNIIYINIYKLLYRNALFELNICYIALVIIILQIPTLIINYYILCFLDGEEPAKGFTYQNASELEAQSLDGIFAIYEGGGYAHTLGKTQKSAAQRVAYLKENNWIDKQTRAVFVEFTTFNPQLWLFSVSFIHFEMAATGGQCIKYKFY